MVFIPGVPYFRQQRDYTCAVAVARMAYGFRSPGEPVPEEHELVDDLRQEGRIDEATGMTAEALFFMLRDLDLNPQRLDMDNLEVEVEAALAEECPVFAGLPLSAFFDGTGHIYTNNRKLRHAALIIGIDEQRVYLYDPDDPRYKGMPQRILDLLGIGVIRGLHRVHFFEEWRQSLDLESSEYPFAAFSV